MNKQGRYTTSGLNEDQYMPGSDGTVLLNLRNVTSKVEMEQIETRLLFDLTDQLLDEFDRNYCFTAHDIRQMHRRWLGTVYEWAGRYRQVMISKAGFVFAAPAHIPALMNTYEKEILEVTTPCIFADRQAVIAALALAHTELVLIHPFREGNGRISRLLSMLMALQAGLPLLDFSELEQKRRLEYFAAVQHGMSRNYQPMEKIFTDVIARSLQNAER
jgi:cell filamentation protein